MALNTDRDRLAELEKKIDRPFSDPKIGLGAISHSSVGDPDEKLYFRKLAYVGDAIATLATKFSQLDTSELIGELVTKHDQRIEKAQLAGIAESLEFKKFVKINPDQLESDEPLRSWAECVEAVLGAVLLDSNFETALEVAARLLGIEHEFSLMKSKLPSAC